MEIQGRIQNGVVILGSGVLLPEGATVRVLYPATATAADSLAATKRRIQLPLVRCDRPGSVDLTNERVAELLDAEEAAPRR